MNKRKNTATHLVAPHLFLLSALSIILITFAAYAGCFLLKDAYVETDYWLICLIWVCLYIFCCTMFFLGGFLYLGAFQIQDTQILLFTPLRKRICLEYDEISDIGIDFAVINGRRQFWIYLCKDRLSEQYVHKLQHMPINGNQIKLLYTPLIYNELLSALPQALKKRLENSKTILQVYDE